MIYGQDYKTEWGLEDYKNAISCLCDSEVERLPEIVSSDIMLWSAYSTAEKYVRVKENKKSIFALANLRTGLPYEKIFEAVKEYKEKLNFLGSLGD